MSKGTINDVPLEDFCGMCGLNIAVEETNAIYPEVPGLRSVRVVLWRDYVRGEVNTNLSYNGSMTNMEILRGVLGIAIISNYCESPAHFAQIVGGIFIDSPDLAAGSFARSIRTMRDIYCLLGDEWAEFLVNDVRW